jgi:ribonucrease Y
MGQILVAIGIGLVTVLLRIVGLGASALSQQAVKAQENAEATEKRIQHESELQKNAILLEAKEAALRIREQSENGSAREARCRRPQRRPPCARRTKSLEARRTQLEEREANLVREAKLLAEKENSIENRIKAIDEEVQRISGLNKERAKELYLKQIESEFYEIGLRRAKQVEAQAILEAEKRAKKIVLDVIQRSVVDYVTEATLAVVELPSEDMKGRIIGREGRNIRAFEQVTGVDLIIDETPEAVVISCFDPVRRETARLALMNLMVDGRIHPGRIEELYEKAQHEVTRMILEAGERAAERANVPGLSPKVIETMGRLRFRTSYAQNVLDHSVEVARLAENLAAEMGLNTEVAKEPDCFTTSAKLWDPSGRVRMP